MMEEFKNMDKGIKQLYDTMDNAIKQLKRTQSKYSFDKVSDCCNAQPFLESEDMGICVECKEHCEYVCDQCFGDGVFERNVEGADVEIICEYCNAYEDGSK